MTRAARSTAHTRTAAPYARTFLFFLHARRCLHAHRARTLCASPPTRCAPLPFHALHIHTHLYLPRTAPARLYTHAAARTRALSSSLNALYAISGSDAVAPLCRHTHRAFAGNAAACAHRTCTHASRAWRTTLNVQPNQFALTNNNINVYYRARRSLCRV